MNPDTVLVLVIAAVVIFALFLLSTFLFVRVWVTANLSGVPMKPMDMVGMRLRRSPVNKIVDAAIVLHARGIDVPIADVEVAYLSQKGRIANAGELADFVEAAWRAKAGG